MGIIRQFKPGDLDSLYAISLATGFEGDDASHLYDDPKLMGQIYSAPYAALEPELALVVEDARGIAGFAVGAVDTQAWENRLERQWWPPLRRYYADPPEARREAWTPDERRAFMIHHPTPTPDGLTASHPAHIHVNLLPRAQGRGLGSRLLGQWRQIAASRGAGSLHVGVNRQNIRAIAFWRRVGFAELDVEGAGGGRTTWMGLGE